MKINLMQLINTESCRRWLSLRLVDFLKTDEEKINFSKLLIEEFQNYGYGTLSKNDLQDLIIYCLNSASNQDFINDYSNYDLAKILKTTDTKIKNMRMNITQKYDNLDSKKQLLKLFKKIKDEKIKLTYDNEKSEISLGIENNVLKRELETISKQLGHTLNYKRNKDIVVIDMTLFIDIVEYLNHEEQNEVYKGFIDDESKLRKSKKVNVLKEKILEMAVNFTKDVIISIIANIVQ
jgi:hypothetical protein